MIKERPILMCEPMVRAILEGRKTQTRRVMKPQPDVAFGAALTADPSLTRCPYGVPGDRLWVRETWGLHHGIVYRATDTAFPSGGWKASIYMPRKASRITLEITGIRVQMVQEISEEDVIAEGIVIPDVGRSEFDRLDGWSPKEEFSRLWDRINAKRGYPWDSDPWVWAISFRRFDEGIRCIGKKARI